MKTVNGMSIDEARRALAAPCTKSKSPEGFEYISFQTVKERMDDVLGWNYSFRLLPEGKSEKHGKVLSRSMIGEIAVYDDNGDLLRSFSWAGGKDVNPTRASKGTSAEEYYKLSNVEDNVAQDTFRRTALQFGACSDTWREMHGHGSVQGQMTRQTQNRSQSRGNISPTRVGDVAELAEHVPQTPQVFHFVVMPGSFEKKQPGARSSEKDPYYVCKGSWVSDNGTVIEDEVEIVFFSSWYSQNNDRLSQFIDHKKRFRLNLRSEAGVRDFNGKKQIVCTEEVSS